MDKYNQIADKIAENGYIATWCTENYARLMLLWLRRMIIVPQLIVGNR